MKSENIQIVERMFDNPLSFLKLGSTQVYENMVVIPIILQDDKFIEFISIKQAEELELIEIVETDSVSQLEVINKSNHQILIPFGMTVHGGKQDRTIWEPILLPVGGKQHIFGKQAANVKQKYVIPAKCIEQSRWRYTKGRGFKSSKTRLHPNVAFEAISAGGQGAVWQEIQSHRAEMKYAMSVAPTQSYLEMTKVSEKKTEKIIKNFKNFKDQCGIAVFINGEFIGIEFYANSNVWEQMSEDIFRAFAIESLRLQKEPVQKGSIDYHDELIKTLQNLNIEFSTRKGIALGNVVEFNSHNNKWRGITLVQDNTLVQFYLVKKRGGFQAHKRPRMQFHTAIDQRFIV